LEYLVEYGVFLAETVTIVVAIVIIIGSIAGMGSKNKKQTEGHIEITNISDDLSEIKQGMLEEVLSEEEYKLLKKDKKQQEKTKQKQQKARLKAQKQRLKAQKKAVKSVISNEQPSNLSAEKTSATETQPSATEKGESTIDKHSSDIATDTKENESTDELASEEVKGRLFVINFDGDVEASEVENLREEITAIISIADEKDEVLLRLESPGGLVHAYGLAASQLSRIKASNLSLTIAVDQVAASGGYMMACVADKIVAAPFAIVGSIGVVAELPNFHRLLKHNKVDYEQHTAGEYKRTITMFSENTEAARKKFKQELEETHDLFKQFIKQNRPKLDVAKVATGEHWYGTQALDLGLIDEIQTSDDYIVSRAEETEIFEIEYHIKKPLAERLTFSVHSAIEKGILSLWKKNIESGLFK